MEGKLYIVGVGPGNHDHMTFRAKQVIDGLWEMNQKFPTMKQIKRIQMGYEYNKPIIINKNNVVVDQLDIKIDSKLILDTFEHFICISAIESF